MSAQFACPSVPPLHKNIVGQKPIKLGNSKAKACPTAWDKGQDTASPLPKLSHSICTPGRDSGTGGCSGTSSGTKSGTVSAKALGLKALQTQRVGQAVGQGVGQVSQAVNRQAYPPGTFFGDMFIAAGAYTEGSKLVFCPPLEGPAIDPERWELADILSQAWFAECRAQKEVVVKEK